MIYHLTLRLRIQVIITQRTDKHMKTVFQFSARFSYQTDKGYCS